MTFTDWLPVVAEGLAVGVATLNLITARISANSSKASGINIAKLTEVVKEAQTALTQHGAQAHAITNKLVDLIKKYFTPPKP